VLEIGIVIHHHPHAAEHVHLLLERFKRLELGSGVVIQARLLGHPQLRGQAQTIEERAEAGGKALARRRERLALAVQEAVEEGNAHHGGGTLKQAAEESSAMKRHGMSPEVQCSASLVWPLDASADTGAGVLKNSGLSASPLIRLVYFEATA